MLLLAEPTGDVESSVSCVTHAEAQDIHQYASTILHLQFEKFPKGDAPHPGVTPWRPANPSRTHPTTLLPTML